MQRAMQTAIHMFKGHPNLANITFFVEPSVHEIMHTTNDLHMDACLLMQKYAPGQPACHGVNFDFSRISNMEKPQLWCIETLPKRKADILSRVEASPGGANYANLKAAMLEGMIGELPAGSFETKIDCYHRAQELIKPKLREFEAAHPVQGDEKIAVVCHSQVIASMTADGYEGEGPTG